MMSSDRLIVPLLSGGAAGLRPAVVPVAGPAAVQVQGPGASRVRLFTRSAAGAGWRVREDGAGERTGALGIAAVAGPGPRGFTLRVGDRQWRGEIAPVLLASSLDPVQTALAVRNPLTQAFCETLVRLCPCPVAFVEPAEDSSDLWMQDAVEFGVSPVPEGENKVRQVVAPLLGLRARHDRGLDCAPLDKAVAEFVAARMPDAAPVTVGVPLPGRRWIDWYGNLEVSPPISGFPMGRIMIGRQKELTIHPALLAFLEAQTYQWPPLEIDVSWLTIGHVDEVVNFVPCSSAAGGPGFRVLLPSVALARALLEKEGASGRGAAAVFAGRKGETTVQRLLDEVGSAPETAAIDAALRKTRAALCSGLGISEAALIEIPCLFRNGLAVVPNAVNSLIVERHVFAPQPGIPAFQEAIQTALKRCGLSVHFLDVYEPYHVRSGEIHCGTNAVRTLREPRWWRQNPPDATPRTD